MIFRDYITEVKFTKRSDYKALDRSLHNVIKYLYETKYKSINIFKVQDKIYYCVLLIKNSTLEPHFGVFNKEKFIKLSTALKENNKEVVKELINDKDLSVKDAITDTDSDFIKIASYVFSILFDFVKEKPIVRIKVMGIPIKYRFYKSFIRSNIDQIDYNIEEEDKDTFYETKNAKIKAKCTILKYKLS